MWSGRARCTASSAPSFCRRSMRSAAASGSVCRLRSPGTGRSVRWSSSTASIWASASWEIDFFGRIRSLKESALEQYLATEQARRSAQILLVSEVANAYLTLAADRESLKLAESTLETQQGRLQFDSTAL